MPDQDTQRPKDFPGENAQTDALAPENENREQNDEPAQAQTLADEALRLHRAGVQIEEPGAESDSGSAKAPSASGEEGDIQDVVDHMNQMETSGRIDNSAFAGSDNHDDNVDALGRASKVDDLRGDGS